MKAAIAAALLALAPQLNPGTPPTAFWCATDLECELGQPHIPEEGEVYDPLP